VLAEAFETIGATLMGRRMFDHGEGPWGDDPPFHVPVFVLTHERREPIAKDGGTSFTFVTEGLQSALEQARAAAGTRDVSVAGGANVVQQCLEAGVLDELQVHIAPVLLGAGRRLFDRLRPGHIELETMRVIESPAVTHLKFRVAR
jgi:dihydrofolate reductase